jgi:hypothetical protein
MLSNASNLFPYRSYQWAIWQSDACAEACTQSCTDWLMCILGHMRVGVCTHVHSYVNLRATVDVNVFVRVCARYHCKNSPNFIFKRIGIYLYRHLYWQIHSQRDVRVLAAYATVSARGHEEVCTDAHIKYYVLLQMCVRTRMFMWCTWCDHSPNLHSNPPALPRCLLIATWNPHAPTMNLQLLSHFSTLKCSSSLQGGSLPVCVYSMPSIIVPAHHVRL